MTPKRYVTIPFGEAKLNITGHYYPDDAAGPEFEVLSAEIGGQDVLDALDSLHLEGRKSWPGQIGITALHHLIYKNWDDILKQCEENM